MRILLDTNIILRNAVQSDPQHGLAHEALEHLVREGWELCIGSQNIMEFWVVATRPVNVNGLGLSPEQARTEADVMMEAYTVLPDSPDVLNHWLDLCTRHAVSGRPAHDARLVALMQAHGVTHLLTLNTGDFARYTEIICLSPVDVTARQSSTQAQEKDAGGSP